MQVELSFTRLTQDAVDIKRFGATLTTKTFLLPTLTCKISVHAHPIQQQMASKFVSTTEICPVCNEKVYAMDRFVIEKMVIHKGCFKVSHQ